MNAILSNTFKDFIYKIQANDLMNRYCLCVLCLNIILNQFLSGTLLQHIYMALAACFENWNEWVPPPLTLFLYLAISLLQSLSLSLSLSLSPLYASLILH